MILNSTLKTVRVVLGEAITTNECDVTASWGDYAGTQFLPGSADTATNATTPVIIVGAPGLNEQRLVQEITVYNADTVPHTVLLQLDNNSTIRVFRAQEVPVGGMLIYSPSSAADVVNAPAAVLLESGTLGAKISALPAFSLTTPPDGSEKLPVVEAGATDAITLAQLYVLFTDYIDYIATNPLSAPGGSGDNGLAVVFASGAGDGVGNGGAILLQSGAGTGTGAGGAITISSGVGAPSGNVDIYSNDATQSGSVSLGSGNASSSSSGVAQLYTGSALGGASGRIELLSGDSDTAVDGITITSGAFTGANGNGGAVDITSGAGAGSGVSGVAAVHSGDSAGDTGAAFVYSGNNTGAGVSGDAGAGSGDTANGKSGEADLYTGSSALAASGNANISTGAANGANAGNVNFSPGSVAGGDGNGGDVVFNGSTGHGAGRQGLVLFLSGAMPTADPLVSGALWVDPVTHIVKMSP